ncbi:MAG: hypothetical protein EOO71_02805, partial [Myxococcaceae bacterium]
MPLLRASTLLLLMGFLASGCKRDSDAPSSGPATPTAPKSGPVTPTGPAPAPFVKAGLVAPVTAAGQPDTGEVDLAELRDAVADPRVLSEQELWALTDPQGRQRDARGPDGVGMPRSTPSSDVPSEETPGLGEEEAPRMDVPAPSAAPRPAMPPRDADRRQSQSELRMAAREPMANRERNVAGGVVGVVEFSLGGGSATAPALDDLDDLPALLLQHGDLRRSSR